MAIKFCLVTFVIALCFARIRSKSSPTSPFLNQIHNSFTKRSYGLEKCSPVSACGILQMQPGSSQYWAEEICNCGVGSECSLDWDLELMDGKSVNNGDTQLKMCRPVHEMPICMPEQPAVVSFLETSVARPTIRQAASVLCDCPAGSHEYKLLDAGMMEDMENGGERTVVTVKYECVPVVHCRPLQPCKFLAVTPTGENITHYTCQCSGGQQCPTDPSTDGKASMKLDKIAYYPFFCN